MDPTGDLTNQLEGQGDSEGAPSASKGLGPETQHASGNIVEKVTPKEPLVNNDEGPPTGTVLGRRERSESPEESALTNAPRKRRSRTDPIVSYGRHFGRAVHAFCNIPALIKNGIARNIDLHMKPISLEDLSEAERREHSIYTTLLDANPGLEERLCNGTTEEVDSIAAMLTKGSTSSRADDNKTIKSAVIDWITPKGGLLSPPITRNVKADRGFYHYWTGKLLCPAGVDWDNDKIRVAIQAGTVTLPIGHWPIFLYEDYAYDDKSPWKGLFRSKILITAYKHVFLGPSLALNRDSAATRSGNAELHGMTSVTKPSIAYVATMVRFGLSSNKVFSKTGCITESERFYNSVSSVLVDPPFEEHVTLLMGWWNARIFPGQVPSQSATTHMDEVDLILASIPSVLSQLKAHARARNPLGGLDQNTQDAGAGSVDDSETSGGGSKNK